MKEQIIQSLLWTDLYKLTMGQGVFHNYHEVWAAYELINRGNHQFPEGFGEKLREQVEMMSNLALSASDRKFLENKSSYFKKDYLDWFENYRFDPEEVDIEQTGSDLNVGIKGPWYRTIFWEVPLMTTISELYFSETGQKPDDQYIERALEKGKILKEHGIIFVDFGTRRAFSTKVHDEVLEALIKSAGLMGEGGVLLGTSNVALAKKYDIKPIGTYAHEWVMGHAALFGSKMANEKAMEVWQKEFSGQLGIALSDTYTTKAFLESFKYPFAKLFDGTRQDSGIPIEYAQVMLDHYAKLGIDVLTKSVVFSDGLDVKKVLEIHEFCKGKIKDLYGIGTNLTNDVGVDPLNFVIKLFGIKNEGLWIPVAKLSDDKGKESGDPKAIKQAKIDNGLI